MSAEPPKVRSQAANISLGAEGGGDGIKRRNRLSDRRQPHLSAVYPSVVLRLKATSSVSPSRTSLGFSQNDFGVTTLMKAAPTCCGESCGILWSQDIKGNTMEKKNNAGWVSIHALFYLKTGPRTGRERPAWRKPKPLQEPPLKNKDVFHLFLFFCWKFLCFFPLQTPVKGFRLNWNQNIRPRCGFAWCSVI